LLTSSVNLTLTRLDDSFSGCNLASAQDLCAAYNGCNGGRRPLNGVFMDYRTDEPIKLTRDCQVVAVPAGHTLMLPQGTEVMITQSLGGSYTLLVPSYGGLFRLSSRDADAIGRETRAAEASGSQGQV